MASLALPLITTGISALGGFLGNRSQKTTQNQTPQLSSDQQRLLDMLTAQFAKSTADPDLSGYAASQTDDINHMAELQKQNILETLAGKGVSPGGVAAAVNRNDSNRFSSITKLRQSIPQMAQAQRLAALGSGTSLFNAIPTGNTTVGTTPGNAAAGGLGNAASTLAYFLGQGAFGKTPTPTPTNSPVTTTSTFNPGSFYQR